jgi:hypothetical protein
MPWIYPELGLFWPDIRKCSSRFKIPTKVWYSILQVTFDVAWSPDCTDGRCYDVVQLSKSVDFFAVMAYDEMSQIFGPECTAYANSPFNKTKSGIYPWKLSYKCLWAKHLFPT